MQFFRTMCVLYLSGMCVLVHAGAGHKATGRYSMVVSAQHLATRVGDNVLRQGGNAIDAAVAMGYALAVVHPCCGNIGGGGFMLIHRANGRNVFLNFRETAPLHSTPGDVAADPMTRAYRSIAVPGTVLGLNTALKEDGTWPLARVLAPAIEFARKGYRLTAADTQFLNYEVEALAKGPNASRIFLNHGLAFKAGDRLAQPALAKDLARIAVQGSHAFYGGSIAKKLVTASDVHHGFLSLKDFKRYKVRHQSPLRCHYRGYTVLTSPPPSRGGVEICQLLSLFDQVQGRRDCRRLGFVQTHLNIMQAVSLDSRRFIGDPDFSRVPVHWLLSSVHRRALVGRVKRGWVHHVVPRVHYSSEGQHTTAYVVVDKRGNVVVVTYTLNDFFGARVVPKGTGILLNSEMKDFEHGKSARYASANKWTPGKRPASAIAPTLVMKHGCFVMALAAPGGPTIPTQIASVIERVVRDRMPPMRAVNMPHYHMQGLPDRVYMETGAMSARVVRQLKKKGYVVHVGSPFGFPFWGGMVLVRRTLSSGRLLGVMDARRPGGRAIGH